MINNFIVVLLDFIRSGDYKSFSIPMEQRRVGTKSQDSRANFCHNPIHCRNRTSRIQHFADLSLSYCRSPNHFQTHFTVGKLKKTSSPLSDLSNLDPSQQRRTGFAPDFARGQNGAADRRDRYSRFFTLEKSVADTKRQARDDRDDHPRGLTNN